VSSSTWDLYVVTKIGNGFLVSPQQSGFVGSVSLMECYYARTEAEIADLLAELRKRETPSP
jgi:hypothetical protein